MNRPFAAALLAISTTFAVVNHAQAQSTAPDFPTTSPTGVPGSPPKPNQSPAAKAREERRQRMSPEEARRDQQLEILEARAGGTSNTTFGKSASQSRQYENSGGGFKVKQFKDKRAGTNRQKRGQSHAMGGIDPKGERLVDKKRKKKFLLF